MQNTQYNRSVAVIGSGYWGKNLVRNFNELGALHTICESDADILNGFSGKYRDVQVTNAYIDVLNTPEINAIVLATPAETHYFLAKEALLSQKDVFVEKPLALKVEEGADLVRIAKAKGQILMVGHLLHYHPAIIKIKELLQAGELGRMQYIYSNRLNLGKVRREENILWSFAPHDISVMLSLCEELPREVACFGGNYLHQQIADVTVCTLSFPSGIKGHIFVSWLHPVKEQRFVVVGSDKMIIFDDTESTHKLLLYPHKIKWQGIVPLLDKKEAIPISIETDEPLKKECVHFLDCIQNRHSPLTSGDEGLSVLMVLAAFQQSLENRGRLVGL